MQAHVLEGFVALRIANANEPNNAAGWWFQVRASSQICPAALEAETLFCVSPNDGRPRPCVVATFADTVASGTTDLPPLQTLLLGYPSLRLLKQRYAGIGQAAEQSKKLS